MIKMNRPIEIKIISILMAIGFVITAGSDIVMIIANKNAFYFYISIVSLILSPLLIVYFALFFTMRKKFLNWMFVSLGAYCVINLILLGSGSREFLLALESDFALGFATWAIMKKHQEKFK
jgi:hypothetical protein